MAELKTKETNASVTEFLDKIEDPARRDDCYAIIDLLRDVTKEEPKMWGSSIIGFGRYRYASGRDLEWPIAGFASRKNDLTLYVTGGVEPLADLLARLGKHKTAKSCLYIRKLSDVDLGVLRKLLTRSVKSVDKKRIRS